MTLQPGDRKFGHGDSFTVTNGEGDEVSAGDLVYISGYDSGAERPEVSLADDTTGYHAVAKQTVEDGEELSVQAHGIVKVNAADDVAAGETPAGSSNAGQATNDGDGDDVFVTPETDGYAFAHLK